MTTRPSRPGRLWAIASYYNPANFRRRYENYRRFRDNLRVPLLTVEFADGPFALRQDDADRLIQLSGGDVMWQKERLLNKAVESLPADCQYVAWIDCDVMMSATDWARRTEEQLEQCVLLQLFREAIYWKRDAAGQEESPFEVEHQRRSLVSGVSAGLTLEECFRQPPPGIHLPVYSNGLAWAARRELLTKLHLYDSRIVGGGDRALVCAAYGRPDLMIARHQLNEKQAGHYRQWAGRFYRAVDGKIGFVDQTIFHLWHGDARDRGLASRQAILREADFDPESDIALGPEGCWRWNSSKPVLHQRVRDYFFSRREDG